MMFGLREVMEGMGMSGGGFEMPGAHDSSGPWSGDELDEDEDD